MQEQTYEVLESDTKRQILEQKMIQYEASHYDASLELSVAEAAGDVNSAQTQRERATALWNGLLALRREHQAMRSNGNGAASVES